jgi:hypothetical protein
MNYKETYLILIKNHQKTIGTINNILDAITSIIIITETTIKNKSCKMENPDSTGSE